MKLFINSSIFLLVTFFQLTGYTQSIESNTNEEKVPPYTLPDPLKQPGGNMVTTSRQWNDLQRPYIYQLFEENVYGAFPLKKIPLRYTVREVNKKALNNLAIRKQVRLYFHPTDSAIFLDVLLYLPKTTSIKVPVFIGYNFSGNHSIENDPQIFLANSWVSDRSKGVINNKATDSSRGSGASQWQVTEIIKRGYGIVTAYYGDIEPDHPEGWKTGIRTSLKKVLQIAPDEWGAIGAWAWGLGRIVDYLQQEALVDSKKIAVIGHSRLGKAALWAAASDQRCSLVISNESGEGGAALSKRWYGETVGIINQKFPHWFCSNYKK